MKLLALGVVALLLAALPAHAARNVSVIPPCTDWAVSSLTNGQPVRLYCRASGEVWLPLDPRCTGSWKPSYNARGWLVLTCDQASITIYPRPL